MLVFGVSGFMPFWSRFGVWGVEFRTIALKISRFRLASGMTSLNLSPKPYTRTRRTFRALEVLNT